MKAKISVIVPVLNREKLVIRCLNSIKAQTELPYELIVVDNGSTDATVAEVTKWMLANGETKLKLHILEESRKGACLARQKGLENAGGDYMIFFDSDDVMLPDLIKKVKEIITYEEVVDIVCWKCLIHRIDGKKRTPPFNPGNPMENHLIHTLLRPQGYAVRSDLIKRIEGWSKPLAVWNDYELGFRLLLENPRIVGINEVLAKIYGQEDSITGKDFTHKEGLWEKTIEEMRKINRESKYKDRARIDKMLDYKEVILASHYASEGNNNAAQRLMKKISKKVSGRNETLLRMAYNYTRKGGRGAWRILRLFYLR